MLVDLKELMERTDKPLTMEEEMSANTCALIAIAERLDRLCDLIERGQNQDGTPKAVKPL